MCDLVGEFAKRVFRFVVGTRESAGLRLAFSCAGIEPEVHAQLPFAALALRLGFVALDDDSRIDQ